MHIEQDIIAQLFTCAAKMARVVMGRSLRKKFQIVKFEKKLLSSSIESISGIAESWDDIALIV